MKFGQSKRKLKGVIGKRGKKKEERNEKDGIRTRQGFGELKRFLRSLSCSPFSISTQCAKIHEKNVKYQPVFVL